MTAENTRMIADLLQTVIDNAATGAPKIMVNIKKLQANIAQQALEIERRVAPPFRQSPQQKKVPPAASDNEGKCVSPRPTTKESVSPPRPTTKESVSPPTTKESVSPRIKSSAGAWSG